MYQCKLCNKHIKLIKQHLKFSHNRMNVDEYFHLTQDEDEYKLCQKELIGERRKNSPNCIEFYLNKGFNEAESQQMLLEHRNKLPFKNKKDIRPNQILYWTKQGFSEEEAKQLISNFQSRSKSSYIKKYGVEEGVLKYQQFCNSLLNRKSIEIDKICQQYNVSKTESEIIFKQKRCDISPRRVEYWKKYHNMNENDATQAVKKWQSYISPRCIEYWQIRGSADPKKDISQFQDFVSIRSIMNRYNCSYKEAITKQNIYYNRYQIDYKNIDYVNIDFKKYSKLVRKLSDKNYRLNKNLIDPFELRSNKYHLDHRVSIIHCYMAGISIDIASCIENLQILYYQKNLIKSSKSNLSISELINKYYANQH